MLTQVITNVTDKTRKNIIQVTIRVSDRQSQLGGYTINFYHTTSKMLVRDRPFNLKGGVGYGFLFRSEKFLRTQNFFCRAKRNPYSDLNYVFPCFICDICNFCFAILVWIMLIEIDCCSFKELICCYVCFCNYSSSSVFII
jgi:hypothetical protein